MVENNKINVDICKFNSRLHLFISAMNSCSSLLEESILNNNRDEAFIHFYHFLCDLFAFRENLKMNDTNIYRALKNYYECIKHFNNYYKVQDINLLISSKRYPFSYPYTYGPAKLMFKAMDVEIAMIKTRNNRLKTEEMLKLHKDFLENKNVVDILNNCIKDCEHILKEKT